MTIRTSTIVWLGVVIGLIVPYPTTTEVSRWRFDDFHAYVPEGAYSIPIETPPEPESSTLQESADSIVPVLELSNDYKVQQTTEVVTDLLGPYQPQSKVTEHHSLFDAPDDHCRLVDGYDWDRKLAYAICRGESNGNTDLVYTKDYHDWGYIECRGSHGIMQIGCPWANHFGVSPEDLHDPETNMDLAYKIYQRSDDSFRPWGAYTNGRYKRFLDDY